MVGTFRATCTVTGYPCFHINWMFHIIGKQFVSVDYPRVVASFREIPGVTAEVTLRTHHEVLSTLADLLPESRKQLPLSCWINFTCLFFGRRSFLFPTFSCLFQKPCYNTKLRSS